ncbi:MAG: hypothetical protein ACXAEX_12925 [Promethearchaeota archaeon]|jgi:hypothetical protein
MKIKGLKIHRKVSWLVASFSFIVLIIVSLRKFLEIYTFYHTVHLVVEWALLILLVTHCILSQKYLKLWIIRIVKGLKNKRIRSIYALRLIQLLTNRVIIILAALVVLSGLGYYGWYANTIGIIIPFDSHQYYDFFLLMCIIIHVTVGFKFMFMRKKIKHWSFNLFIVAFGSLLIIISAFLNFLI